MLRLTSFERIVVLLLVWKGHMEVMSHAAPDLNDLVQEVVRGGFHQIGAGLMDRVGHNILTHGLSGLSSSLNSPTSPQAQEVAIVENYARKDSGNVPILVGSEKANSEDDSDPQRFIPTGKVTKSCNSLPFPNIFKAFTSNTGEHEGNGQKICVPLAICSSYLPITSFTSSNSACTLDEAFESVGVCCSESLFGKTVSPNEKRSIQMPYLNNITSRVSKPIQKRFQSVLSQGTKTAMTYMQNLYKLQTEWIKVENSARQDIPILKQVLPEARDIGDGGIGLIETMRSIANTNAVSRSRFPLQIVPTSVLTSSTARIFCTSFDRPQCTSTSKKYRTLDGSCNNVQDTSMGQVFQPLIRITKSFYEDGVFTPRKSSRIENQTLPSTRMVSSIIATRESHLSKELNFIFAEHGQFVAHDMSHVPVYDLGGQSEQNGIRCCSFDGKPVGDNMLHPFCLPIDVPQNDSFYAAFGVTCMPFVRSMVSSKTCTLGAAEQINQQSHWMDLSQVYGPLEKVSTILRDFSGGRLKSFKYQDNDNLILNSGCNLKGNGDKCAFETGDLRGNHQLYLTMLQTIWHREHNRIAKVLAAYHPEWSDEILFQETRRIVIAEYRHITFNEFISVLLGHRLAERFQLLPKFSGYTEYNPEADGSVSNEHTTAAFRMGHSMIYEAVNVISKEKTVSRIHVRESIERPMYFLTDEIQDGLIRGCTRMSMENMDQWVTSELTNHLFQSPNKPYGLDLVAINLQRGRDHGLPGYVDVLNFLSEYCGLPLIASFSDMTQLMKPESVSQLQTVYAHPQDVDLYIAGLLETPVDGGLLGPTFGCIIADQFSRTKFADRFHYEHGDLPNSFDKAQLQAIRSSSAARLFCDNGKDIKLMQPLALRKISPGNHLVNCADFHSIPQVDLSAWKDNQV